MRSFQLPSVACTPRFSSTHCTWMESPVYSPAAGETDTSLMNRSGAGRTTSVSSTTTGLFGTLSVVKTREVRDQGIALDGRRAPVGVEDGV